MIYAAALALVISSIGFYFRARLNGVVSTTLDAIAGAVLGWISGLLIGCGARFGMWAIPFFNGTDPRVTFDGTLRVILTFSLFGIGLGVVYETAFRRLFRNHGLLFGALITLLTSFPLSSAALQQLSFTPGLFATVIFSLLFVGSMFVPFAFALEYLLARWHRFRGAETPAINRLQSS